MEGSTIRNIYLLINLVNSIIVAVLYSMHGSIERHMSQMKAETLEVI